MKTHETAESKGPATPGQYRDIIATLVQSSPSGLTFEEAEEIIKKKGPLQEYVRKYFDPLKREAVLFFRESFFCPPTEQSFRAEIEFSNSCGSFELSEDFKLSFAGYRQPAKDRDFLAVCEFIGNPSDHNLLDLLGREGCPITLGQLKWALQNNKIELGWTYVCFIVATDGELRIVCFSDDGKTKWIKSRKPSNGGWWANNIRVLHRNFIKFRL